MQLYSYSKLIRYILKRKCKFDNQLLDLVSLFFVVIGIVWGAYRIIIWMQNYCYRPLSYIVITGNRQYTTNTDIHQLIMQLGALKTFITQDVNIIQKKIESLSWIKQVSVRKQWPDILKINLIEHIPIAQWNDRQRISMSGAVFNISNWHNHGDFTEILPILYGPEGSAQDVLIKYYIFKKILQSSTFQIKSVKMDAYCSWQLVLQNNIKLKLGRQYLIERLRYFIKIYPILLQKINEKHEYIDYVDLRYKSGCAVKWVSNSITPILCNK